MSPQYRGREEAYDRISRDWGDVGVLLTFIDQGVALESSYGQMVKTAKLFLAEMRADVAHLNSVRTRRDQNRKQGWPSANESVRSVAGKLLREVHVYYEFLLRYSTTNVLPQDYDTVDVLRNHVEHGTPVLPMCYIPAERDKRPGWELAVDLATLVEDLAQIGILMDSSSFDRLVNLSQEGNRIINLSHPLEMAVSDAMRYHFATSEDISILVLRHFEDLQEVLEDAEESGDDEVVDILRDYLGNNEVRQTLAEENKKLTESWGQ